MNSADEGMMCASCGLAISSRSERISRCPDRNRDADQRGNKTTAMEESNWLNSGSD